MIRKIILWCKRYKEKDEKNKFEFDRNQAVEKANELYQVREFNGKIWLTFDGHLVAPVDMFVDKDIIRVLDVLRGMYVCDIRGFNNDSNKEKD